MSARKLLLGAVLGMIAFAGAQAAPDPPPVSKPPVTKSENSKRYSLMYRKSGAPKTERWHLLTGLTFTKMKEKQTELKKKGYETQVRLKRPRRPSK